MEKNGDQNVSIEKNADRIETLYRIIDRKSKRFLTIFVAIASCIAALLSAFIQILAKYAFWCLYRATRNQAIVLNRQRKKAQVVNTVTLTMEMFEQALWKILKRNQARQGFYMERQLCILDICGLDVGLIVTDDKKLLGCKRGRPSFGKYSVDKGTIWLDVNLTPSVLRSHLFHEMYEFILGYFNVTYHPGHEHESFMRFSNILWCVFKANQEILFGDKLTVLTNQL